MGKISTFQLFSLLTVSRLLATLTFMPFFDFEVGVSDLVVATLLGAVLLWVLCIPVMLFLKHYSDRALTQLVNRQKTVTVLFCAYLFFVLFFTLLRLKLFVSSVFFSSVNTAAFTVATVLAVCYCASFSLEATARSGSVTLFLLLGSLGIIFAALTKSMEINNLSPVFYYGFSPVLKIALSVLARSGEPLLIYMLAPRVTGNIRKGLVIWLSTVTVLISVCVLILSLTLSDNALLQAFPFHAMSELSRVSAIERMDSILTAVWIMSAFLRAVLLCNVIGDSLKDQFPKLRKKYFLTVLSLILIVSMLIAEKSLNLTAAVSSVKIREALFAVFVLILPTAILIKNRISERKTE